MSISFLRIVEIVGFIISFQSLAPVTTSRARGLVEGQALWCSIDVHALKVAVALDDTLARLCFILFFILDYKDNKQYDT